MEGVVQVVQVRSDPLVGLLGGVLNEVRRPIWGGVAGSLQLLQPLRTPGPSPGEIRVIVILARFQSTPVKPLAIPLVKPGRIGQINPA